MPSGAFVFIKYSAYYEGQDEPYDSSYLRNEVTWKSLYEFVFFL